MSDYPNALDYFVDRSRVFINQNDHQAIIVHGTGGNPAQTAQQLGDFFRNTPDETSVTYGIDRTGVICQYVLEVDGAGGNGVLEPGHDPLWDQLGGNPNVHTISIEHVNDQANSLPLTDVQKQASFNLIAYLSKKYTIPVERILPHASIAPISRSRCPGPAYPWDELHAFLQGGSMGIPSGWHDDGTTLTAPNGVPVVSGFRDYILNNSWDPNNWPLAPEAGHTPLEASNPTLGGGTQQIFRFTLLEWTPDRGVFVAYIGAELLAWRTAASHPGDVQQIQNQLGKANAALSTIATLSSGIITSLESILATAKSFQPS